MALINQKMGGQPQGLANYVFYRLAATPGIYHDITAGDNKVPDTNGQFTVGYAAAPGFDLATALRIIRRHCFGQSLGRRFQHCWFFNNLSAWKWSGYYRRPWIAHHVSSKSYLRRFWLHGT